MDLATTTTGDLSTPPSTITFRLIDALLADKPTTTQRQYTSILKLFAAFTGHPDAETAAQSFVRLEQPAAYAAVLAWKSQMLTDGLSPATINNRLACLRSVAKRARKLGLTSITIDVDGVKARAYRDTRGPGMKVAGKMLRAAVEKGGVKGARDAAIVSLALELGLRRGEIVALDFESLDLGAGTVDVVRKGYREAITRTLPRQTQSTIASYLEHRGCEPGPLFESLDPGHKGTGRMNGGSVYRLVRSAAAEQGVRATPHGLRHTAITAALDATGGDIRSVRAFSGHADPRTVMIYDDARQDDAGRIAGLVASALHADDEPTERAG